MQVTELPYQGVSLGSARPRDRILVGMCFSPLADLAGGGVVGAIGIDTARHVDRRADWPLASLPLIFAGHFLTETFVWWGHDGVVSRGVEARATWLYLLVALVVVPFIVPIAVTIAVPVASQRRAMTPFCVLGAVIAAVMLVAVVRGPVTSQIQGHHIVYGVNLRFGGQLTALYVVATCGVMLASRDRVFVAFGLVNLAVVALLGWLMVSAFISLWCAWAAVTSVAIDLYVRRAGSRERVPTRNEPAQLRLAVSAGRGIES
jgi:hypothetical protein